MNNMSFELLVDHSPEDWSLGLFMVQFRQKIEPNW
jgi:hypothetical protein